MATVLRRGSRLGKYRLDRCIGRGGFAEVWRSIDTVENRRVALKVTHRDAVESWGAKAIQHEAQISCRLDHPAILKVRNADWIDGRFVMASDLARTHLGRYLGARRSGATALRVVSEIAHGLAYAHERRVMHRDVKPENILIFDDGRAVLADFGASRFVANKTQTYTDAGTLGYMAPEQAYGRARLASDVFSLALISYELLSGGLPAWPFEWPFPGHEKFAAKAPEEVHSVFRKAAQFDPRKRYPDAVAFSKALDRAIQRAADARVRNSAKRRKRAKAPAPSPTAVQAAAFRRTHGKELGLRYRCRRCEGPISEPMRFCPWCGSKDNSFVQITRSPLVCPECEKGVRPEWSYCPWCYAGRFEPNGRKPPRDAQAKRSCTRRGCDGQLRLFMTYCPLCKQKPRRAWVTPALPDRCPRCRGGTHHAYFHHCPWCGRPEASAGKYRRASRSRDSR